MEIKTNKDELIMKSIDLLDISNRYNLVIRNKEFLGKWLEWVDFYKSEDVLINFSKKCIEEEYLNEKITFLIYYKDVFVGQIDLQNIISEDKKLEIGYWLGEEYNGNGIMKECVSSLLDNAFTNYKDNEVIIRVEVQNYASLNIPIKLGFEHKETKEGYLLKRGSYYDVEVYSMSRDVWMSRKRN